MLPDTSSFAEPCISQFDVLSPALSVSTCCATFPSDIEGELGICLQHNTDPTEEISVVGGMTLATHAFVDDPRIQSILNPLIASTLDTEAADRTALSEPTMMVRNAHPLPCLWSSDESDGNDVPLQVVQDTGVVDSRNDNIAPASGFALIMHALQTMSSLTPSVDKTCMPVEEFSRAKLSEIVNEMQEGQDADNSLDVFANQASAYGDMYPPNLVEEGGGSSSNMQMQPYGANPPVYGHGISHKKPRGKATQNYTKANQFSRHKVHNLSRLQNMKVVPARSGKASTSQTLPEVTGEAIEFPRNPHEVVLKRNYEAAQLKARKKTTGPYPPGTKLTLTEQKHQEHFDNGVFVINTRQKNKGPEGSKEIIMTRKSVMAMQHCKAKASADFFGVSLSTFKKAKIYFNVPTLDLRAMKFPIVNDGVATVESSSKD